MPGLQHGIARIIIDLAIGFVISTIVTQVGREIDGVTSALLFLLSMIPMIELFSKMNRWSLTYLIGYIFGLLLLGPHLLSTWEFMFSFAVSISYMIIKGSRKISS